MSTQALASAQTSQDAADQAPAQQAPPQQQTPPPQPTAQPTAQPAGQPQDQTQPENPQQPETRRLKLPPAPPRVTDVRMPGEAGWFIGITGWLPVGNSYVDKGKEVNFTDPSLLQLQGSTKGAYGAEFGIAAGLHNSLRFSWFFHKQSGSTTLANDIVVFSQVYNKGDEVSTNSKLSNYKASYEFLTWPYPVEARRFRLKTLFQVQYVTMRGTFDAPVKSATPDSSGNLTDYSALGSKSYFTPAFGLGVHEYASRNFRFEANVSGFIWPHSFHLLDTDAVVAYRAGKIELRAGAKGFIFRTSPNSDYFYRGSMGGLFVGLRWYSD